jgi:hypothetical protein
MSQAVYPQTIVLPGGVQARVRITHVVEVNDKGKEVVTQLVSDPPQYELRDGTPVDLDVQIPDDLAAAGWIWHGSLLHWPTSDPLRGVGITTDLHPPPGWPSPRDDCFTVARRMDQHRAEYQEQRIAARVAKATKAPKAKKDAPAPAAVQMELF